MTTRELTNVEREAVEHMVETIRQNIDWRNQSNMISPFRYAMDETEASAVLAAYDIMIAQIDVLTSENASLRISNIARGIALRNCESNEKELADDLQHCSTNVADMRINYMLRTNDLLTNTRSLEDRCDHQRARIKELEYAITLSIDDINLNRADVARDRLFKMVKLDETEES